MNSPYTNDNTSHKAADAGNKAADNTHKVADGMNKAADNTHKAADAVNKAADNTAQKTSEAVNKAADGARNLTDNVLQGAQSAVEATKDAANASMDKAQESVKQWRNEAEPVISDMAAKAQALAERSINYCAHTGVKLRDQVDEYTEATTRYVKEQPGKSVAIAAAAGAALTLATMALMRRRGD